MSAPSQATVLCLSAWVLVSTAVAQTPATAPAVEPPPAQRLDADDLPSLEREFWRCDHAATRTLLDGGTAMQCGIVIEALEARRFGGDFTAMLAGWRAHKDARHSALSGASPGPVVRVPDGRPAD